LGNLDALGWTLAGALESDGRTPKPALDRAAQYPVERIPRVLGRCLA